MASFLFAGKVNHVFSGEYISADASGKTSVYIKGPKQILFVLVEATSSSCPNIIDIAGTPVPVFTNRVDVREVDFTDIWVEWFNSDNTHRMEHDCVMANNELTTYICTENASSIGLAVMAELYSAMYIGLGIPTMQNIRSTIDRKQC